MNTPRQHDNQANGNSSRRLLTLLGIIAVVLLVVFFTPWGGTLRNPAAIDELMAFTQVGDFKAVIAFVAISSLLIMVGTPRLIFFTFGSFAFGFWSGLFYSLCGCLMGSFMAFSVARWGARDWLSERFGKRRLIARIVQSKPTILSIALLRFLPISNALVNIGLALSGAGLRELLLGSLLGYLPQGVIAALIGSGLAKDAPWTSTLHIGIAGLLLALTLFWTVRIRRKQA